MNVAGGLAAKQKGQTNTFDLRALNRNRTYKHPGITIFLTGFCILFEFLIT
jgi:hypothetical protein